MNVCITPDSLNLFAAYFQKEIPTFYDKDVTAKKMMTMLFNKALSDFSDKLGVSEKDAKELILQHLTIAPEMVYSYMNKPMTEQNPTLFEEIKKLRDKVIEGSKGEKEGLTSVISELGSIVGSSTYSTSFDSALLNFNPIALELNKTYNREAGFKATDDVTNENLVANRFIEQATIELINNPKEGTKLQAFSYSQVKDRVDTMSPYTLKDTDLVLVPVDAKGNFLKFDSKGKESESGKTPLFKIKETEESLEYQRKNLPAIFARTYGLSIEQATEMVNNKIKGYLQLVDKLRSNVASNKNTLLDIDYHNSSTGFIKFNVNNVNSLKDIANIDEIEMTYVHTNTGYSPRLKTPGSSQLINIVSKPLNTMSDEVFEALYTLVVTPDSQLKVRTKGQDNLRSTNNGRELIKSIIPFTDKGLKFDKGNTKVIYINEVAYAINEESKPLIKEELRKFVYGKKGKLYSGNVNALKDVQFFDSLEATTNTGQLYLENGQVFQAEMPTFAFAQSNKNTLDGYVFTVSDFQNGEIILERQTLKEKIIGLGHVIHNLNYENELKTDGAYLTFTERAEEVLSDDTDFENYLKNNEDADSLFQSIAAVRKTPTVKQEKKAENWLSKNPLTQILDVNFINELHEKGPNFVAEYINGAINLYIGSSKTDVYHEAFHAFSNGILSEKEQLDLYAELKKKPGYFTVTVHGVEKTLRFENASNLELEEYLAEEFRAFAMAKGKFSNKATTRVSQFFEKLYNLLKGLFGNMSLSDAIALNRVQGITNTMFNNLYEGNIDVSNFRVRSTEALYKSSELKSDLNFSLEETHLIMDSMQSLFTEFIDNGVNYLSTENRDESIKQMMRMIYVSEIDPVKESDKYEEELSKLELNKVQAAAFKNAYGLFRIQNNPKLIELGLKYVKQRLVQQLAIQKELFKEMPEDGSLKFAVNTLTKAIANFGNVDNVKELLDQKGVDLEYNDLSSLFLNKYSFVKTDKLDYEDSEDRMIYDRVGNEFAISELVDDKTKQLLSTITDYTLNGKGRPNVNVLGITKHTPFKVMFAKVVKLLANTIDGDVMYAKLKAAAETDGQIKELVNKLGDPAMANTVEETMQWVSFWQAMNKADVFLREQVVEQKVEGRYLDEEFVVEKSQVLAYSGRTSSVDKLIVRDWNDNFNSILEQIGDRVEYSNGTFGRFQLNINKLIKDNKFDDMVHASVIGGAPISINQYNKLPRANRLNYAKTPVKRAIAEPFKFLKSIGIQLSEDPVVKEILSKGNTSLNIDANDLTYFYEFIKEKGLNSKTPIYSLNDLVADYKYNKQINTINTKEALEIDGVSEGKKGFVTTLSKLHTLFSSDNNSFMAFTAYGEKASEKSLNSSLTVEVQALNAAQSYDELIAIPGMEKFNYELNPSVAGSRWFVDMFNLDKLGKTSFGKRNQAIKVTVENLSGSKLIQTTKITDDEGTVTISKDKGVSSLESDEKTKFITDLLLTSEGFQEIPRSEAKSSSLTVYASQLDSNGELVGGITKKPAVSKEQIDAIFKNGYKGNILSHHLLGHLEFELQRISKFNALEQEMLLNPEKYAIDYKYFSRGKDFFIFDNILDPALKTKLLEKYKQINVNELTPFTIQSILSKEDLASIENELVKYFSEKSNELYKLKGDVILPESLINTYKEVGETTLSEKEAKERLFKTHIVNNFIQNVNYTSLFLGDLALYDVEAEDFHKRNAGMISTGKIFAAYYSFVNFVNTEKFNAYGYAKSLGLKTKQYSNDLKTAILDESVHESVYLDEFKKLIGEENISAYKKMEEADGQGWITFDTYRILNIACDEWSDGQEALYNKIINGEKISSKEIKSTFPVKKFQYYGPVRTEGFESPALGLTAFHKYSLAPLVPTEIAGTKLEQLHKSMMEQGIDYATMQSGSKLSTISRVGVEVDENGKKKIVKVADTFYDKQRNINEDIKFVPNIISVKHLKNQVFIDEGFKGKITLPTQMRKMVLHGIADNGVPTDFLKDDSDRINKWNKLQTEAEKIEASDNYKWYSQYTSVLQRYKDHVRQDLLENIDFHYDANTQSYVGDSKKLAEYIKAQMLKDDFLPQEVEMLTTASGKLISDLSYSTNSQKIEEILVTLVDSSLRKLKVTGEALVQVSGAMYEKRDIEGDQSGTNGLRFYEHRNEDNELVLAMEVKIALQGEFKKLLKAKHNGKSIAVYTDNKLDEEASLANLNAAIKDAEWRKQHENMLTFPGARIPTQGPNALDVVTVAEFLPEYTGAKVILPSEIVAKTGADYDIDKMFFMFPSIALINGKPELKKYTGRNTNIYDELAADLEEANELLYLEQEKLDALFEKGKNLFDSQSKAFEKLGDIDSLFDELYKEQGVYMDQFNTLKKDKVYKNRKVKRSEYTEIAQEIWNNINDVKARRNKLVQSKEELIQNETGFLSKELKEKFKWLKQQKEDVKAKISQLEENVSEIERELNSHSLKGLENELIQLFNSKILSADNLKDLLTPNSTDHAKPISEEMERRLMDLGFNKNKKINAKASDTISRTTPLDYLYNLQKHQENSVGMESLGIAAVVSTYYAVFTTMNSLLNTAKSEDVKKYNQALTIYQQENYSPKSIESIKNLNKFKQFNLKLKHNNVDGRISLGNRYSSDGKLIADTISQLINGYVDVAKKAWIFNAQGTKENTPNLLFMVMAGVSLKDAIYVSSNPLTIRYNQIKKELAGTYANLDIESGVSKSDSNFKINEKARAILLEENKDLINASKFEGLNFTGINNVTSDASIFETQKLLDRVGSKNITADDLVIFSQYVAVEKLSDDVTEFSQITKYDTKKVSNMTDAEQNKSALESFMSKHSAIPHNWIEQFQNTPIGIFNNNEFILNLFERFFKIKNNSVINRLAISLNMKNKEGLVRDVVRNAFKNDFMWFLYQNAVYKKDSYTSSSNLDGVSSFKLEEAPGINSIKIEDGVVKYDLQFVKSQIVNNRYIGRFFDINNSPVEYVKYHLEKTLLNQEIESEFKRFEIIDEINALEVELSSLISSKEITESDLNTRKEKELLPLQEKLKAVDDQIREKFYYYGSKKIKGNPIDVEDLLKMESLFRTKTPNALFDKEIGYGAILKAIKNKHKDLADKYSLVEDLKFDTESKNTVNAKTNLYLREKNDPILNQVYLENLKALRSHKDPLVREFFSKNSFEHMAFMQAGMNTASKYYLGRLTTGENIKKVIDSVYPNKLIIATLNQFGETSKRDKKKVKEVVSGLIGDYFTTFDNMNQNDYKLRSRGYNYVKSNVEQLVPSEQITLVDNIYNVDESKMFPFDVIEIFNETDSLDDIIEKIKEISQKDAIAYPKQILDVPNANIEEEMWNQLLLDYLGIDNTKDFPQVVGKSITSVKGGLSIANSVVRKQTHWIKDQAMANASTKAIAFASESNPNYKKNSSTRAYLEALAAKGKTSTNGKFSNKDKVWIFGAGVFKSAYEGLTDQAGYTEMLKADFNNKYVPMIDLAIKKGVTEFNVGTANGIDQMAVDYLLQNGYSKVVMHSPLGKYYKLVNNLNNYTSDLYNVTKGSTTAYSLGLQPFVEHINSLNLFKGMSENEIKAKGYNLIAQSTKEYFKENPVKRQEVATILSTVEQMIEVGNNAEAFFLEKYLMKAMLPAVNAVMAQAKVQDNSQKVYEPIQKSDNIIGAKSDKLIELHNNGDALYVMRVNSNQASLLKGLNENKHFGNPFTGSGVKGQIQLNTQDDSVLAYEKWLDGENIFEDKYGNFHDLSSISERRDFINEQIDKLKAKAPVKLGYFNSDNLFSHASILDERINGVKALRPSGEFFTVSQATLDQAHYAKLQEEYDFKVEQFKDGNFGTVVEQVIAKRKFKIMAEGFYRFSDRNFLKDDPRIAKTYFDENGREIDDLALELDVEVSDIIDFMINYPQGIGTYSSTSTSTFYGAHNPKLNDTFKLSRNDEASLIRDFNKLRVIKKSSITLEEFKLLSLAEKKQVIDNLNNC